MSADIYPTPRTSTLEGAYCTPPREKVRYDLLFVGAGIGLADVRYALSVIPPALLRRLKIGVFDAGPMDLPTHVAHCPGIIRRPFIRDWERIGGKLAVWGVSTPRPPLEILKLWPYEYADLARRFESVERELGVPESIPMSGRDLELQLKSKLADEFSENGVVTVAPLAINRRGERYCPLKYVGEMKASGVDIVPNFRCSRLVTRNDRCVGVRGTWSNGRLYRIRARNVFLGVGVEAALPLLCPHVASSVPLQAADHIRVDMHGSLAPGSLGTGSVEELGVAVLVIHLRSRREIPYHLEVKVAPCQLWTEGYMQSSDNLLAHHDPATIYIQVQAVSAMHDRYPSSDLLNVGNPFPPVYSSRDEELEREIREVMRRVCASIGLSAPMTHPRPLGTNHHTYGAFRVGGAVSPDFRFMGYSNLFVLPPTAFVDIDDDANPTLKSLVLSQYAVDAAIAQLLSNIGEQSSIQRLTW